jgi:membrane-bound lytic murein transglycosylase B
VHEEEYIFLLPITRSNSVQHWQARAMTFTRLFSRFFLITAIFVYPIPLSAQERDFDAWLAELRQEALDRGISAESVELAFSEITPPVQRIISSDRAQPERVQTYAEYLGARVSDWKIENGRKRMIEHADLLKEVGEHYGVQPRFIVAFWGMETNFGTYPIPEPLFNVLVTLSFDNRRASFFRAQFFAALEMLESGFPPYEQMKSSWAGAMGQSQFIPESYLQYAVDYDGDGNRDIWNSEADVFASIANYIKARGWRDDLTWGRPVALPPGGESRLRENESATMTAPGNCSRYSSLGVWRDLQQWQALGVRQADGSDLPGRSIPAALVYGDAGDDEAYLVYGNFCGIMAYNPALKYALSIGLLSDLIVP